MLLDLFLLSIKLTRPNIFSSYNKILYCVGVYILQALIINDEFTDIFYVVLKVSHLSHLTKRFIEKNSTYYLKLKIMLMGFEIYLSSSGVRIYVTWFHMPAIGLLLQKKNKIRFSLDFYLFLKNMSPATI